MSVTSEITRIKTNIANAYTELKNKEADIPEIENSENLASSIASISSGPSITKGIIIKDVNENGFVTDIEIKGVETIPGEYLYHDLAARNVFYIHLKNIELDSSVKNIGNYAFYNLAELENINLDNINSLGTYCLYGCKNLLIDELPNGITIIPNYCFANCSKLQTLTCKGDITQIGSYAFRWTSLKTLILPNITSVPELLGSFGNTNINSGTIYVPDNLVEDFKVATNWSSYASRIKGISEM